MASIHRDPKSPFWYCAFYLPDGRRAFRSTGTTDKRKALSLCMKFAEAADLGREGRYTEARARQSIADIFAIANKETLPTATVRQYLTAWLERKRLEVSEGSAGEYERVANDLLAGLGLKANRHIDAVTVNDVAAFRDRMAKRVTPATVNKALKIMRGAWARALKDGVIRDNAFARLDLVKDNRKAERRAFTLDEVKRILGAASDEWRGIVLFGFYTGQRLGDVARLTWQNVDTATGEIRLVTQKTKRTMIMPMAPALLRYVMKLPAPDDPKLPLFPTSAGLDVSSLSRQFVDLLASIGLVQQVAHTSSGKAKHRSTGKGRDARRATGGLSFHCLRHTTTSALKNAGVNNAVAMELIGHDSEAISRAYTHMEADTLKRAVAKLPDVTKGPNA